MLATLVVLGIFSPAAVEAFQSGSTPLRIAVALGLLFPAGFFMGMAFPIGMKWANRKDADHTAWLWGVNGAASVCVGAGDDHFHDRGHQYGVVVWHGDLRGGGSCPDGRSG